MSWLMRHDRILRLLHRAVHRGRTDEACVICAAVWHWLDGDVGFRAGIEQAKADIAEGRVVRWLP